jgi:alpha-beta hydrolase superfamily lysophospholipase
MRSEPILHVLKKSLLILAVAFLGFIVGGLSLYILSVRNGPPLDLWHTVDLTAEFDADRPGEVETFSDYLALEDRLFTELDEKVYANTPTGPHLALARYSRGSQADPRRFETDWNRSFELRAETPRGGVLLLHGMSDSPYSLRALGESLNEHGYWVVGLRLPGHGTAPSGIKNVRWEDMAALVSITMKHLATVAGENSLHLVGYSTGASLALEYSLSATGTPDSPKPESLVLISPAVAISPAAAGASWLRLLSTLPGLEKLAWTQILPEFDPFKYNSFAVNAGDQVHRLTRRVVREIAERSTSGPITPFPRTLVFLSTVDSTVTVDAAVKNLLVHLAADRHELVLFDINRSKVKSTLLVADPGPLTAALMRDDTLSFHLTIVGNEAANSDHVLSRRKSPRSSSVSIEPLGVDWPAGVISLSHIALPFPMDDPLYGARPDGSNDILHLGNIAFLGERGLLKFPADWLLRLRHNPFYDFQERRTFDWIDGP